ncbi:alpha-glucosidase-like [Venturia canescens]|uniref:alpha-glucosidase-like n=1 Tax=Venturia canescens TaxID=32260 RepID=UPI001C9CAE46|nr:alpha-glucosidase-like [Venturia canescens]
MLSRSFILCGLLSLGASWIDAAPNAAGDWWANTFIYQIYPRSFKDSNGDGVGDLNGITSKLEHLADLGVSALWISPIYPSPMVDFGYDIANFTDVDPIFGTLSDFDKLVAKAKSLGLKVLLDFVPNHTSHEHPWFKKSVQRIKPYDNYYTWRNGTVINGQRRPPNNWLSTFGGSAWEWNESRGQYYLHQFAAGQPDINYRDANLVQEMKNALSFWMKRGVDGFRIDAINHMFEDANLPDEPVIPGTGLPSDDYDTLDHLYTKNLNETYLMLKQWRDLCDNVSAGGVKKILLTEAYASIDLVAKYYNYGSNVPFNFMFMGELNNRSKHVDFKRSFDNWFNHLPANQMANWVVGNHDQRRVTERFGTKRADQLSMLAAVLPGVGVIYNGDEIGMEDVWLSYNDTVDPAGCNAGPDRYNFKSRDPERTPFQWDDTTSAGFSTSNKTWLPVHSNYKTLNLAAQKKQAISHYSVFKKLVILKKQPIIVNGATETILVGENVLAVVRRLNSNVVVLLINFSESSVVVDASAWLNVPSSLVTYTASVDSKLPPGQRLKMTSLNLPGAASIIVSDQKTVFDMFHKHRLF